MKVCVIGGGPAGILAAISASKNSNNEVVLYEKNEKLGKKLFITGKGRCNITNSSKIQEFYNNIVRNSKFMYSSLNSFSNGDFMRLLTDGGLKIKVERGNRVFPESDKSYFVTDTLRSIMLKQKVSINLKAEVLSIKKNEKFAVLVKDLNIGKKFEYICDKLIIATGGLAYPSTGSTGDGYKFAKDFGINVTELSPALVPLNIGEINEIKKIIGLNLKNVAIKILNKNKKVIYKDFGEMKFEEYGVTGPTILSASSYIKDEYPIILSIDLKPALDYEMLDKRLLREFSENKMLDIKEILKTLLPRDMIDIFIDRLNTVYCDEIDSKKRNVSSVSDIKATNTDKILRKCISRLLKDFRFTIVSKRGYEEAIITRGGIDVKEINPKTMESKKVKGLYFAGEVLDVDALTGGYNIQIAASTGYVSGINMQI